MQARDHFSQTHFIGQRQGDDARVDADLFGGLTRKHVQALVFAVENGYYPVPKKVTTKEMASRLKLPRTTYEEHLRKAEGKVIRSMAPYISMRPSWG